MNTSHSRDHSRGSVAYLGMAATLFVASGGLLGGYFLAQEEGTLSATRAPVGEGRPPVDESLVRSALDAFLDSEVTLHIGDESVRMAWSALGAEIDPEGVKAATRLADAGDVLGSLGASGAVPVTVERGRAVAELERLKAAHDQEPQDARMDLEAREIHDSRDGVSLDIYGSLSAIELAARTGADSVTLRAVALPAEVTVDDLGIDDISHVLARFETRYAVNNRSRNFNLKLAASKLNGYVLQPGVEFSFNEVVGARTEKEGYKVAHVITAGEMVDGLAGGTCQISTTLHGAAFFAGLDIVRALPHSRPSAYVTMGLDATVVYPYVDLKLRNDYDFPVAIHYKVTRGRSVVEILGKERPYDKVMYEREIIEKLDFDTVTREDDSMPVGTMRVDQFGFYGYKVDKIRKFFKDGKMVKRDKWTIRYAPVTEYARIGINPDPNLAPPEKKKQKRLKEPDMDVFRMVQ